VTRGRKPNIPAYLDVLRRLQDSSLEEIRRATGRTVDSLRHYIRELTARGLIEPARYFSHLSTDGSGAKRYILTRLGRRELERLESSTPTVGMERQPISAKGGRNSEVFSARATNLSALRYSQRYVGAHNFCFRMVIEEPFERPFRWASEHPMGPRKAPRWMSRHATYEPGVHIEEAGGTIRDAAGAAGHLILLKFAVLAKDRNPVEVEREAESRSDGIRRTLEMMYGCRLSEPELRGHPKHSFPRDPFARLVRAKGVSIHGPIGVDDTPEEGTLEIADARQAQEYVKGVSSVPKLAEAIDRLTSGQKELGEAMAKVATGLGDMLTAQAQLLMNVEEVRRREPTGPTMRAREN